MRDARAVDESRARNEALEADWRPFVKVCESFFAPHASPEQTPPSAAKPRSKI
jgi:hypothetical protein